MLLGVERSRPSLGRRQAGAVGGRTDGRGLSRRLSTHRAAARSRDRLCLDTAPAALPGELAARLGCDLTGAARTGTGVVSEEAEDPMETQIRTQQPGNEASNSQRGLWVEGRARARSTGFCGCKDPGRSQSSLSDPCWDPEFSGLWGLKGEPAPWMRCSPTACGFSHP